MLGARTIITREPRNIQALLATQFKDFAIGPRKYKAFSPLLGNGIFTIDGPGWEISRALLRPQFARSQITQLENLEEHLQILMDCITEGEEVDLQELFFELTIDTATHFLCGESCNVLLHRRNVLRQGKEVDDEVPGRKFAQCFNTSQDHLVSRFFLQDLASLHNPKEFKDSTKFCHEFIDRYVKRAIEAHRSGKGGNTTASGTQKYVFLEAIVEETQDPIILRDALLNILLAGRDTTASLLAFVFYLLVRYPEVEKKLRATIYDHFGDECDGAEKPITFETLKGCHYLRWVVDETLRVYPTVPLNSRMAVVDTTLPLGGGPDQKSKVFIPKGTSVEYSVYAMHRREDIWGSDANWFRPERWGEPRNSKEYGNFEYLPFNGGPRICLGQQFALTEASYTIVRMFQRFKRFENAELNQFVRCNTKLTMAVGGKGTFVKCFKS
ncbi:Protein kinase alk2 [Arthrobotrys megalospora]